MPGLESKKEEPPKGGGGGGGETGKAPAGGTDPCSGGVVTEACRGGAPTVAPDPKADTAPRRVGKYMEWPPTHRNYALDKELVNFVVEENTVLVTWANFHYLDFAVNWVEKVRACGINNYLVGAMDEEMLVALHKRGIHTFSMSSGTPTSDFGWGTKTFFKMGQEKIQLIQTFLGMGFTTFITDIDTAIMRNPFPFFARYPLADILVSSDGLRETDLQSNGEALEVPALAGAAANIGIMFFKPQALGLVKEWVDLIMKDSNYWDQNAFNDLFRKGVTWSDIGGRLFKGYNGQLTLGILPTSTFASGHTFYVQRMFERLKAKPYIVHNTFQFSGTLGKRHRFREFMLWTDPSEYYDPPGGLMTYDATVPEELLRNSNGTEASPLQFPSKHVLTKEGTDGHFKLMNWQLSRLRHAMGVATALGRVLVMPELHCGMDRWWAPHNGIIPGSGLETPFICPLDHVIDLEQMGRMDKDPQVWGPPLRYREYSLMRNPALPASVKASRGVVQLCKDADCTDSSSDVALPPGLKSEELIKALEPLRTKKVLHFSSMEGAFGGFTTAADQDKFEARIKQLASIWCCVRPPPKVPGHIWYDLLWDMPGGHIDKHNRHFNDTWVPILGP